MGAPTLRDEEPGAHGWGGGVNQSAGLRSPPCSPHSRPGLVLGAGGTVRPAGVPVDVAYLTGSASSLQGPPCSPESTSCR